MTTKTRSRRRRSSCKSRQRVVLQKPNGVLHPRVQRVEPQHFGIVSVDVAKVRSKWMLCNFYGDVIIEPVHVEHGKSGFENAIEHLRRAIVQYELKDLVVAVERTGNYHESIKRTFRDAGFETHRAAFSDDGSMLAVVSDCVMRTVDLASGQPLTI